MPKDRYMLQLLGSFVAVMFLLGGTATSAGDPQLNNKIEIAIAKVRAAESSDRSPATEELLSLMMGINPKSLDEKTVADLVSLLNDPDFDVRAVVTVALGQLGRKAKAGDPVLNATLLEAMAKVRSGKSPDDRYNAAADFLILMKGIDPMYVDDKTVNVMIRLLDDRESGVRMIVAAALGMLGPRAKAAVPKLLALLPEADCEGGDLTSAAAIRPALERLGVKPPPYDAEYCKKELNHKLKKLSAKVRDEKVLQERIDLVGQLAQETEIIDANSVDDKTLADLVSLLDDPEDAVRGRVAEALGNMGHRAAKVAVPKLLTLLPAADCERGELTSAFFIRQSLKQMGVTPPTFNPENCKKDQATDSDAK